MLWEPRALEIWETFVKNEAFELAGFVRVLIGTYGQMNVSGRRRIKHE